MKVICIVLGLQLIYLGIWWIVDRSKYTETLSPSYSSFFEDVYIPECTESQYFIYIQIAVAAVMFIFGIRLAWSVRKAAKEFNESITLASTFLIMCIIFIINIYLNSDNWCN